MTNNKESKQLNDNFVSSSDWNKSNLELNKKDTQINIYSAFELSQKDIKQIVSMVSKKYNFVPYPIITKIIPELICGVKIVFNSKIIDSTIKGKLEKIKQISKERI